MTIFPNKVNTNEILNLLIVGDRKVGKSTFINCLNGQQIEEKYNPTEYTNVSSLEDSKNKRKYTFLEVNNENPFCNSSSKYYGADIAIIVCNGHSLTQGTQLFNVFEYKSEIKRICGNIPILVVGNIRLGYQEFEFNNGILNVFMSNFKNPDVLLNLFFSIMKNKNSIMTNEHVTKIIKCAETKPNDICCELISYTKDNFEDGTKDKDNDKSEIANILEKHVKGFKKDTKPLKWHSECGLGELLTHDKSFALEMVSAQINITCNSYMQTFLKMPEHSFVIDCDSDGTGTATICVSGSMKIWTKFIFNCRSKNYGYSDNRSLPRIHITPSMFTEMIMHLSTCLIEQFVPIFKEIDDFTRPNNL